MVGDYTPDDLAPAWDDADDTSAWVLRPEDKKIVGHIDWAEEPIIKGDIGYYSNPGSRKNCNLDGNDIFLERIDIWDRGKGYGTRIMNKKHADWKSRGFDSVTLFPKSSLSRPGPDTSSDPQVRLLDWYKRQGYEKSNKCEHQPNCDSSLNCYLTKTLF